MSAPQPKKRKFSIDNKKYKYYKNNKRHFLEPGIRGFLATCNFREKDCVREAYNVLNHYADELYGPQRQVAEATVSEEDEAHVDDDIADDLQKEIDAAKVTEKQQKGAMKERFKAVDTGVTNCIFIRTTLSDPVELSRHIVNDILSTQEKKTRYLLRMLPIEVVCRANLSDIINAGSLLFDKHFMKGSTFSIIFNRRFNNDVHRDDVIRELASLVKSKNITNSVNLKEASKTVVVEVLKGLCCMSVIDDYLRCKKYNLLELANSKEKQAEGTTTDVEKDVGGEASGNPGDTEEKATAHSSKILEKAREDDVDVVHHEPIAGKANSNNDEENATVESNKALKEVHEANVTDEPKVN